MAAFAEELTGCGLSKSEWPMISGITIMRITNIANLLIEFFFICTGVKMVKMFYINTIHVFHFKSNYWSINNMRTLLYLKYRPNQDTLFEFQRRKNDDR